MASLEGRAGAALALLLTFCAGCSAAPATGCGEGAGPPIDACDRGVGWADCGGSDAAPVLACSRESPGCFWFAGGCVARGFEASPCPASDVCCQDDYPFDASWRDATPEDAAVHDFLVGLGTEPWDATRSMVIEVSVDPAIDTDVPSMTCSDDALGAGGPCDGVERGTVALPGSVVVVLSGAPNLSGWSLVIEARRGSDGVVSARACRYAFVDGVSYTCPAGELRCADGGTLELSSWPVDDALDGHLVATFGDTTVDARF